MKPRVLAILAGVTAGVLLVAFLATRGERGESGPSAGSSVKGATASGEMLFPELRAHADAIVELRVSQGDKHARIVRDAGTQEWRVATLGGYPANSERVRDTVRSIADAKVIERKTARKESHAAVGLEDPAAAGARSILVEAMDAQGQALARIVLGDVAPGATPNFDPNASVRFVRRADEDQSYLVTGRFPADPASTAWVVRSIVEIPATRVREVRVSQATGPALIASRESESGELAVQDIPSGRTVKDQTQVARLAQAFAFLTLEGVKPASDAASLGGFDGPTSFDVITFDHLLVRARVKQVDGDYWAMLDAMAEQDAAPAASPTSQGGQGEASAPSANGEVSIDDAPGGPQGSTPAPQTNDETDSTRDAARAEAEKLNAKLSPWIFKLSASKGAQLTTTPDDLLTPSAIQGPQLPVPTAPVPEVAPPPLPSVVPDTPTKSEPEIDPAKKLFPDSRP